MKARHSAWAGMVMVVLASAAAHAAEPACPAGGYWPVRKEDPFPGLFSILPPLAMINALATDKLRDAPVAKVGFRVVEADGRPAKDAMVGAIRDEENRFIAEGPGDGRALSLPHGAYTINAARRDGARLLWGTAKLNVGRNAPKTVTIKLEQSSPLPAIGPAPAAQAAGTTLAAPIGEADRLTGSLVVLAPSKDGAVEALSEGDVEGGVEGASSVTLPSKAGRYRVLYLACAPRTVLAEWSVTVNKPDTAIAAPDRIGAGEKIPVTVSGTSPAAIVRLEGPDGGGVLDRETLDNNAATLDAPLKAGRYRLLAYAEADQDTPLARRDITVEPRTIAIEAPAMVEAGQEFEISWPGGTRNIEVQLWSAPEKGKAGRKITDRIGAKTRLPVPAGDYELRLVDTSNFKEKTLATRPIRLEGSLFAAVPAEIPVTAAAIRVELTRKGVGLDRLAIVPRGQPFDVFGKPRPEMVGWKTSHELDIPDAPGDYDVIYVMNVGLGDFIAERKPLLVR